MLKFYTPINGVTGLINKIHYDNSLSFLYNILTKLLIYP